MGADPNTQTLKAVWQDQYQLSHYKMPVFRALAYEKQLSGMLRKGDTIHWSYMSDFYVNTMGADGSYTTQAQTDTDETLVINTVKETSFYEFEKDLEQAHYSVKVEYAKKAMNKIWLQIDADVLLNAYQQAANVIDNGIITGGASNGTPIVPSVTNIFTIFTYADLQLRLNNVDYTPNARFTSDVKLEKVSGMRVAIISAQMYQQVLLYVGGKTTLLGDDVTRNGHVGFFMGFSLFVSNAVPCSCVVTLAATPTTGDSITINGLTFTFVTSATNPGEMTISGTTQALFKASVTAPFTAASGYVAQTDNVTNRLKMANIAVPTFAANATTMTQTGLGVMTVTQSMTSASNTVGKVIQHCIMGVSNSVGIVIQRYPRLYVNPVSGKVGKDYVTWVYYGIKVFKYMTTQLLDVQIDSTGFTQPTVVVN